MLKLQVLLHTHTFTHMEAHALRIVYMLPLRTSMLTENDDEVHGNRCKEREQQLW
jgi:hypothetical protein